MTWAPPYASSTDLAGWLGVADDPEFAGSIEAASRAIDQATGRQFGSASQSREYMPDWKRGRAYVKTHDMAGVPTLVETLDSNGNVVDTITNFVVTPRNAVQDGQPYTGLEYGGFGGDWYGGYSWYGYGYGYCYPHPSPRLVRVTAEFGWAAIPDPIKLATLMQAARWNERREYVGGPLTAQKVDDLEYKWAATGSRELDPDVAAIVAPFRKVWAAV